MPTELKWLGHGSWQLKIDTATILLDPFLDESPTSPVKAADVDADYILVSHGHADHVADVAPIANRTGATVVAAFEVAEWFRTQKKVENTLGMNLGGTATLPFGRVKMTLAHHSSQMPDGSYGGNPGGFLLYLESGNIYFACDTALFSDMQLIGAAGIALAVLPIGDHFTMGIDDSIAATKLIKPNLVAPAHYNTWPPIEQDAGEWAERIRAETEAEPVVFEPGEIVRL